MHLHAELKCWSDRYSCGFPKTRWNDGTADGTAISKYLGRDSPQSVDNYPISTQNPTERPTVSAYCNLAYVRQETLYLC